MSLSLAGLLMFEEDVPMTARAALWRAKRAPAAKQRMYLEAAARALYRDTQLDCADIRELVGLVD